MLKNKKVLITLLLLVAVLLLPNMVNAAEVNATETTKTSTGVDVKWSYTLEGNNIKDLKCTNISAITGELAIPNTIDGHTVTSIGRAFEGCAGLRKVTIPDSVTSIGGRAFRGCSGLTNITIPNSVTSIGSSAFEYCSGLREITIPNSVTSIGGSAFYECTGLTSVTLSANLTKINESTFAYCSAITEIVLPENLTTIEGGLFSAFNGCTALKFIKIPENVVSIGNGVFEDSKNLTIYGKEGSTAQRYAENNKIKFEKIENWDKRNQNSGADITAPTVKSMYFNYSNVMNYWQKTTNDYRIPRGVELPFIVQFTETIKGTEVPTLTIKCGEGANIELKNGTITGDKIVYTYTIKENDEGLIAAVKLEGGNVSDASGNKAVLAVKELKVEYDSRYAYANGSKATSEKVDTKQYISFPFIITNGKSSVSIKKGMYDGKYTMYYQFVEVSDEVYNKLNDLKTKYENKEITYEEYFVQYNQTVTNYNDSKWIKTEDGSFEQDLSKFTGTKKFALWVKLEMEDKTVYEAQVYTMNGSGTATNEPQATDKPETPKKDTTTATSKLPNTGKIILMWSIAIIAVSGIVAHIRYKKLYIK